MNCQAAEFSWTMQRLGKCHSINYRLCAYIRKSKKCRFYTCIFIEKGFRKALRTYNYKKKAVFVCTFRADRGKNGQNARINSLKNRFSYVRMSQIIVPHRVSWLKRHFNTYKFRDFSFFIGISFLELNDFTYKKLIIRFFIGVYLLF